MRFWLSRLLLRHAAMECARSSILGAGCFIIPFLEVGAATDVYILLSEPPVIVGDGEYCEGKVQKGNNSTLYFVS
jgi:hypothetical protein